MLSNNAIRCQGIACTVVLVYTTTTNVLKYSVHSVTCGIEHFNTVNIYGWNGCFCQCMLTLYAKTQKLLNHLKSNKLKYQ